MPLHHMEHVLVQTTDMDATREFYTKVLGMQVGPSPDFKFPVFWLYIGDQDVIHVTEGGAATSSQSQEICRTAVGGNERHRGYRPHWFSLHRSCRNDGSPQAHERVLHRAPGE